MNRADSIVGNTGQQCSAQEIAGVNTRITPVSGIYRWSSTDTNCPYGAAGEYHMGNPDAGYEMSQLPAREVNGQYVVSMTLPLPVKLSMRITAGVVLTCKECTYDNYSTGNPTELECQISADASFTPVQKTLTAGVAFTHLTPSGSGIQNSNVIRQ